MFLVNLSNASNATITDAQGIGTIRDDDPAPALSIGNAIATEGPGGAVFATFTVSLSGQSSLPVRVQVATTNGAASAPADYTTLATTVTFNPGESSRTVSVMINDDSLVESAETFSVVLSSAKMP